MMTVENNAPTVCHMPAVDYWCSQLSSNRARFAGSVSCFTSVAIDLVDLRVVRPAIDRRCFDCKQTTSDGLLLRVYASQWNWACTAFEHAETKTEEVVFLRRDWLSFIIGVRSELVRSYDRHLPEVLPWLNFTPDPQQVQAERFSLIEGAPASSVLCIHEV